MTPEEQRKLAIGCCANVSDWIRTSKIGGSYTSITFTVNELGAYTAALKQENAENLKFRKAYFIEMTDVILKNDELLQELQALREQKPMTHIVADWEGSEIVVKLRKPLYADPVPASEGCVLVPIEPTEEMLSQARKVFDEDTWTINGLYRAMLEAAPKEPS